MSEANREIDDAVQQAIRALAVKSYDLTMLGSAASYDLTDREERKRSTQDLERMFFRLIRELQPDLFIEAGAKDAGSSRRARRHAPKARAVAFEANPYTFKRFREKNADPKHGVEYLHMALSDAPGTVTFNVRKREDGGIHADGQGSLFKKPDYELGYREVSVEATTLDVFFDAESFKSCALWIDVEGASEQVLTGGERVLESAAMAFIEVEDYPYWGQSWLFREVAECFYDAGLIPVARDFQAQRLYNVLFLREELVDNMLVRRAFADYRSAAGNRPTILKGGSLDKVRRRARKLTKTPKQFFADSQNDTLRRLGGLIWR